MSKPRVVKAWADVGSHGYIFEFSAGPVATRYPHLLHVYSEKVTDDLIPVEIRIKDKQVYGPRPYRGKRR